VDQVVDVIRHERLWEKLIMNEIEPKNLHALLSYRGRGNPANSHPQDAISNCFPGLETDFRNVWRRLFVGIELHEATNQVITIEPGSEAARKGVTANHFLVSVDGVLVRGPNIMPTLDTIEWDNALAEVLSKGGSVVTCRFELAGAQSIIDVQLLMRPLFEGVAFHQEIAQPGTLTQSLCSPWQNDYRECACFYWAANRPDFVNVEISGDTAKGHNWLHRQRTAATPKEYVEDNPDVPDPRLLDYDTLFRNWEQELRFQIGGKDAE
jgi:hypothetical protein